MKLSKIQLPDSLQPFSESLQRSMRNFEQTRFDIHRDTLLRAFADIVHDEYSLERFFQVSVTIPLLLDGLQARFYLYEEKHERFLCVCDSSNGLLEPPRPADPGLPCKLHEICEHDGWIFYPLYPRSGTTRQDIVNTHQSQGMYDPDPYFTSHSLLGLYAVSPAMEVCDSDRKFLQILSRWIGNKLNNRLVANRHMEHLQFLSDLGRDIGHNVIVPNMHLKYLLRQVEKHIEDLKEMERGVGANVSNGVSTRQYIDLLAGYREKRQSLEQSHRELLKHHNQITLFLESLFREQHFSQGHLVLQATRCFVERDVILPQLDVYRKKLEKRGITVDKPENLYQQEFPLMVDIGLLSQVYANLFSNAVKYTAEIIDHQGKQRKAVAYGATKIDNFPEWKKCGIKFNVFTTGTPLSESECQAIFLEGHRANNSKDIEGSGHGLSFIRRVIEVHGGKAGCEATEEGNNFYFILPIFPMEKQLQEEQ